MSCPDMLKRGTMFQAMSRKELRLICEHMTRRHL